MEEKEERMEWKKWNGENEAILAELAERKGQIACNKK